MHFRFIVLIALVFLSKGLVSCNSAADTASKGTDSTDAPAYKDSVNAAKHATPPDKEGIEFITKAASGGKLEVQLGNLAETNAFSPRVKQFAQMMITDHTKANIDLKSLATRLQLTVSDSLLPQHAHHKMQLSLMKAEKFDRAYMKMMLNDHEEDITDFEKAAQNSNTQIKSFAGQVLPVLKKHLDSAKAICRSYGILPQHSKSN